MKNPRTSSLLCALLVSISCAAPLNAQTTERDVARSAREDLRKLQTHDYSRCHLGSYGSTSELYVELLLSKDSSLMPGDKVVSAAGQPVSTVEALTQALSPYKLGDEVALEVERNGSLVSLQAQCVDSQPSVNSQSRILSAMADRNWKGCLSAIDAATSLSGPRSLYAWTYLTCSQFANKRLSNSQAARLAYEAWRLQIEEARWNPRTWPKVRGDAMGALATFEQFGQSRLADDIQRLIDSIDVETSTRRQASQTPTAGQVSTGTGFLINGEGGIITSHHVVDGAQVVSVACSGGPPTPARVVSSSASTDLAVLTATVASPSYLSLAPSRSARVGQQVFTYGYPVSHLLGEEPKFTEGVVSSLSGVGGEQAYMQISVPVQPGNSGGPVVNSSGEVVGIVAAGAAIAPFLQSTGTLPQNINWAVKSEYAALLFEAPQSLSPPRDREEAIQRVRTSLCFIRVER